MGGVAPREDVHRSPMRERFLSGVRDQKKSVRKRAKKGQKAHFHEWL
jgi:hypothetical protein